VVIISRLKDLTGQKFGELIVLCRANNYISPSGNVSTKWKCKCSCGKEIEVLANNLTRGHTKSCGCLFPHHRLNHGDCVGNNPSRLYRIWAGMRTRCYSESSPRYKHYGARGIKICDEWNDFSNFKEWALNNGYSDLLSIDRINVNGDYSPENCRWASQKTQGNNTTRNVRIEYQDQVRTLSEWSDILQIPYKALWYRLHSGWTVNKAFSTPLKERCL